MQKTHLLAAAATAATIALAACSDNQPEVINKYDPMEEALKNAPRVTAPPPMIQVTRTYRCRDNLLVFVDFYTNNTAAILQSEGGTPTTMLTTEGGNPPYTGSGYSISGSGTSVTISAPGHASQSCHT